MTGAHVQVTSRLPTSPLMTRYNKSTQAYSSHLELGKRLLEQPPFLPNKKLAIQPKTPTQPIHTIVLFVPDHHPILKSGMCRFILQPHPVKNLHRPIRSLLPAIKARYSRRESSFIPHDARRFSVCTLPGQVFDPRFRGLCCLFKRTPESSECFTIPEVLTVQAFRRHFHDLDALCNVLCSSGESGKLRSLPFLCAVEHFKSEDLVLHKMAERGHGAYIRGIWTECMKPDLYRKATVAWSYGGSQDLEQWVTLGHTALQLLYSAPFPDPVFGVPEKCPICMEPMHFPLTTECGHTFNKACLERTQSPTTSFPFFWVPPLTNVGRFDVELLRESFVHLPLK
ncbi:hypothetical protein TNCT_185491 [Trichonephila clavata]|uniref:Zinc finger RING-type eukaryotic domain-containing protein n=1 Tax=Trichonephila clavata TaxID=2740835 RepID=A0A8X6GB36_TRICU|nr:hypothetical protein TNCT_185491 [Trichonephila clavata]